MIRRKPSAIKLITAFMRGLIHDAPQRSCEGWELALLCCIWGLSFAQRVGSLARLGLGYVAGCSTTERLSLSYGLQILNNAIALPSNRR